LDNKKSFLLDLGCGNNKRPGFVGIDKSDIEGVDIIHDLEVFPWPLESESCQTVVGNHIIEHIKPWLTIDFFNECWRVLKPDGQLVLSTPYAGSSWYWSDPTHCNGFTEKTFCYFDPVTWPQLYDIYRPRPWRIEPGFPVYQLNGNIEVIMTKIPDATPATKLAVRSLTMGAVQKAIELSKLFEMLESKKLKNVLEIGTARGGVFYGLCQLAQSDATVISVDLPGGTDGGGYSVERQKVMATYGKEGQDLHFVRSNSHHIKTFDRVESILGGEKLDLLFIDGDHTYKGVKKDFEMYSPLVKKGGTIVFHDICFHTKPDQEDCEVERFWIEVRKKYVHREFIDKTQTTWGGIGVITK
jgi:predicted O-methyltransferase YrrM